MVLAAIGLGSNLGDRSAHIADAVGALSSVASSISVSGLYETAPVGGPRQGPYLNAVAVIDTELAPAELLQRCLEIEREAGRQRRERWGARTLDLDLLLYGDQTVNDDGLTVPHPRMVERRFVLEPLVEVWPDAALPDGTVLKSFLPSVNDQKVRRLESVAANRMTSLALFLVVGLGAVAIWWIGDWLL